MYRREIHDFAKGLLGIAIFIGIGVAIFALTGCVETDSNAGGGIQTFFTAAGAALTAIPGIGPILGPLVASAGPAIGAMTTSHAAATGVGALALHHYHFGVTPGRRAKLAGAREAHRTMKAAATKKPA